MDYFWKNYQYLCAKKGVSVYAAAKECGVKGTGTVSYWKKGSRPNAENLNSMLEYFNVKPYDLMYTDIEETERLASSAAPIVNDALLVSIQKLTPQQRTLVQGFIAGLIANSENSL